MIDRLNDEYDVVIVGSGPAGVSAAFPLVKAGLQVLMVDGGNKPKTFPPAGQFLSIRHHDKNQWHWMLGRNFHALQKFEAASPKLRVPTHAEVFEGFQRANSIKADNFIALGSLAPGGLSNAWGGGVSSLTDKEISKFPFSGAEMRDSYRAVATRIGVSGRGNDDLSCFFGLDEWSQPPIQIDELQSSLLKAYEKPREALHRKGFRLGRARVAVISQSLSNRMACDRTGNCLWGCDRRSIYTAQEDLRLLRKNFNFSYCAGFLVSHVSSHDSTVVIEAGGSNAGKVIRTKRVLLAAGTLASTRLALQAIDYRKPVSMLSCPTAAFMLWLPRHLGESRTKTFGLGQLSFTLKLRNSSQCYGSLFNTTGIPFTEFARYLPFSKRYSIDLLQPLLASCIVGNLFLPGDMTKATLCLDEKNFLRVTGVYCDEVASLMRESHRLLRASFFRLGAVLLPASFKIGQPGADIHYAATLPMRAQPKRGETGKYGELFGASGIHIVDGASLSSLPAKSHTLTIMANADRIARYVANTLTGSVASNIPCDEVNECN